MARHKILNRVVVWWKLGLPPSRVPSAFGLVCYIIAIM